MADGRLTAFALLAVTTMALQSCATVPGLDPLQVTVAGVEPLEGQGMELRMLVKLRVQNPNDAAVDYNGVAVEMIVQGKTFATGVSDAAGSVPRYGEAIISVPVTASAFRMLSEAVTLMGGGGGSGPITYELTGKLNGSGFNAVRFRTQGQFDLSGFSGTEHGT